VAADETREDVTATEYAKSINATLSSIQPNEFI